MPAPLPRKFGAYVLHHSLAQGGMGEVFLATRVGAARGTPPLVLKILLPEYAGDEVFINMFHDESRISLRLSHPNVVGVHDVGRVGDEHFLVLEYVHGVDLRQLQQRLRHAREKFPLETVLRIGLECLQGLDHAHRAKDEKGRPLNLVHRDLSPENIMVSFDGDVKILDFGIAKAEGRAVVTRSGQVKGKTGYMSPEQAMGEKVDARSDLYALALCMLELITGQRRFPPDTDKFEEIRMARTYVPPDPSQFDPSVTAQLDAVFRKALELDRKKRYQSADEFTQELSRSLRELKATKRERVEPLPLLLLRHFPDRAEPFLVEEVTDEVRQPAARPSPKIDDSMRAGGIAYAKEGRVQPRPIERPAAPRPKPAPARGTAEPTTITESLPNPEENTSTDESTRPAAAALSADDQQTLEVRRAGPATAPGDDRTQRVPAPAEDDIRTLRVADPELIARGLQPTGAPPPPAPPLRDRSSPPSRERASDSAGRPPGKDRPSQIGDRPSKPRERASAERGLPAPAFDDDRTRPQKKRPMPGSEKRMGTGRLLAAVAVVAIVCALGYWLAAR